MAAMSDNKSILSKWFLKLGNSGKKSREKTCETCKYFVKISSECRKRAPITIPNERVLDGCLTKWPFVSEYNWCGDYERGMA